MWTSAQHIREVSAVMCQRAHDICDRGARPRFVQLSKTANIPAYKTEARELIENCWRPNPGLRPSFESIVVTLESILAKVPAPSSAGNGGGCCAS